MKLFLSGCIAIATLFSQMGKLPPSVDQEWKKGKSATKDASGD